MTTSIRSATRDDLLVIEQWLIAERAATGEGFYCNWKIIEDAFRKRELHVLAAGDDVVAFLSGGSSGPDILEVRPDRRGMSYGRKLAEWMIQKEFQRGVSVIEIACAPETSIPFWRRMGFQIVEHREGRGGGVYAYMILRRVFNLPIGPTATFKIEFFPPERDWMKATPAFISYEGNGALLNDGKIQLPERAICFDENITDLYDCVVRVEVSGECLFENKVKRDGAAAIGVSNMPGYIYYIDRLMPPK